MGKVQLQGNGGGFKQLGGKKPRQAKHHQRPAARAGQHGGKQSTQAENGKQGGKWVEQRLRCLPAVAVGRDGAGARGQQGKYIIPYHSRLSKQALAHVKIAAGIARAGNAAPCEVAQNQQRWQGQQQVEYRAGQGRQGGFRTPYDQKFAQQNENWQQGAIFLGKGGHQRARAQAEQRQKQAGTRAGSHAPAAEQIAAQAGKHEGGGQQGHALHGHKAGAGKKRRQHPGGGHRQRKAPAPALFRFVSDKAGQQARQPEHQHAVEQVNKNIDAQKVFGVVGPALGLQGKAGQRHRALERAGKPAGGEYQPRGQVFDLF